MGLMDKAREAAKQAADAGKRGLDEAKTTGERAMQKRRCTQLTTELGDVVFRQRNGEAGLEPEIDRLVADLRTAREQLDAMNPDAQATMSEEHGSTL